MQHNSEAKKMSTVYSNTACIDIILKHKSENLKNNNAYLFTCDECNRSTSILECFNSRKQLIFECKFCSFSFQSQTLRQEHEVKLHNFKSKPCSHCLVSFCKQSQIKCNSKNRSAMCILCNKHFKRMYDLKIHINAHLSIKSHVCDVCGKTFSHRSNLFCHKRLHTGEKPYVCKICNKRFRQVQALNGHELAHSKGICCGFCKLKFKSISGLIRHTNNTHNIHMTSKSAYQMAKEVLQKQSHKFYCSICGERFQSKKTLTDHIYLNYSKSSEAIDDAPSIVSIPMPLEDTSENKKIHIIDIIKDNDISSSSNLEQPRTESSMHQSDEFNVSLLNKNGESHDSEVRLDKDAYSELREFFSDFNVPGDLDLTIKPLDTSSNNKTTNHSKSILICDECGKQFLRKWYFNLHLSVHDLSLRRYSCSHCEKKFAYNSSLETHLRGHSEDPVNYTCLICSKIYNSTNALMQHENRVHKRKVNHACPYCTKVFFGTTEYKYHLRLHNKESPFMCSSCGKKFSHVSHLHRHEKIHSGIRPHCCTYCPKTFIQAGALRRHTKRHTQNLTSIAEAADGGHNQRKYTEDSNKDTDGLVFVTDDIEAQIGLDYLSILNVDENGEVAWTNNV